MGEKPLYIGVNVMGKMGWKTITGALIAAFGYISQPQVLAVLPEKVAGVVTALGGLLAALGLRHAIAKITPAATPPRP